jgi:hypothetical protein
MKKMKSEQAVLPNPCLEEEEEVYLLFCIVINLGFSPSSSNID